MCEYHSADRGMGLHHSVFRECNANLLHVQQVVKDEVDGLVGQGWISYRGAYTLEFLVVQLLDGQMLIGGISPCCLADGFM